MIQEHIKRKDVERCWFKGLGRHKRNVSLSIQVWLCVCMCVVCVCVGVCVRVCICVALLRALVVVLRVSVVCCSLKSRLLIGIDVDCESWF